MSKTTKLLIRIAINIINCILIAAGIYFFFSGKDFSQEQKENARLIGATYMTMNNEFYEIVSEEIAYRVEAEGDKMLIRDPALSTERQVEQIEDMLQMGVDVLVVAPANADGLNEVLQKAKEQGVYIIVVDTAVSDETLADCTITTDNYRCGVLVGEYFLQQHDRAKVVVMEHETAQSARDRVDGFLDTVGQNPHIKIVKEIECEGQVELAMPALQEAIDEGVKFDTVFCLNDLASVGVVAALDENHILDGVDVYGVDASPDAKALIYEGMMQASAAQFPTKIGEEAAEAIYTLLDGGTCDNVMTDTELITIENVQRFGIDRWQ